MVVRNWKDGLKLIVHKIDFLLHYYFINPLRLDWMIDVDQSNLFLIDRTSRSSHKFLELSLANKIWGRMIKDIDIFLGMFPHWLIIRVIFTQIIAFDDLWENLIDLCKKYCLFIFKILYEKLIGDDVAIGMTFVAILNSSIEINSLNIEFNTSAGLYFRTFRP